MTGHVYSLGGALDQATADAADALTMLWLHRAGCDDVPLAGVLNHLRSHLVGTVSVDLVALVARLPLRKEIPQA